MLASSKTVNYSKRKKADYKLATQDAQKKVADNVLRDPRAAQSCLYG